MDIVIVVVVALVVVALVARVYSRRAPRQDAGIAGFRRHIDALSPESRREVMDRVRPSAPAADEHTDDPSDDQPPDPPSRTAP